MVPAYMLIFAGLVGTVTLLFMPEVAGKPLPGSGPRVESEAGELAGA
jgi:MHS family proline/betaine transporter-like MFS transporter